MTKDELRPVSLDDSRVIDEIERYRDCPQPERRLARARLLAMFPALTDELNACLDGLELLNSWPATDLRTVDSAAADVDLTAGNQNLGDFRIIRELGRGGMGVVYEAQQLSLNRRVALKVLPFAAFLDERRLQRFKQEAQAAALLRHPHIVSVYCVGCERGVHYYAMELVEGSSLAELLAAVKNSMKPRTGADSPAPPSAETRPIAAVSTQHSKQPAEYFRSMARLGATLADAIHFAHEHGVVHRDLKPSNLMLDHQGNPWITDFGLAQVSDDRGLTMTGDMLGTLRYMSPEQADGKKLLDHRTDIYSLGATIYEMLTLRPALDGEDRAEILRQLEDSQPARPRAIEPRIPIDLETILLKAMATRAEDRYDTAKEFAEDLQRFLDRKPILARRPGRMRRVTHWVQRHPTKAMLLCTVAFLVFTLAIGGPIVAVRYGRLAKRESTNRKELQRLLSETLTSATEALENTPSVDAIHERLLSDTLEQYERLLKYDEKDPDVLFEHARNCIRLGAVVDLRFDKVRASEVIAKGTTMLERLVETGPDRPDWQFYLAEGYFDLGTINLGVDWEQSAEFFRSGIAIGEQLTAAHPRSGKYLSQLAANRLFLSLPLAQEGNLLDAERIAQTATASYEQLVKEEPNNDDHIAMLAFSQGVRGQHLRGLGRLAEAVEHYRDAAEGYSEMSFKGASSTRYRIAGASHLAQLGSCLCELGDVVEGESLIREGRSELQDVMQGFPDSPWARQAFIQSSWDLAEALFAQERVDEAAEILRSTLATGNYSDGFRRWHSRLNAMTRFLLGLVLWRMDHHDEARRFFQESLLDEDRTPPALLSEIYACCPYEELRDPGKALSWAQRCPEKPRFKRAKLLGMALYRLGRFERARNQLEEARASAAREDVEVMLFLAMAEHQLGNPDRASAIWQQVKPLLNNLSGIHAELLKNVAKEMEPIQSDNS